MFTGIIQEIGVIANIEAKNGLRKFTITAPLLSPLQNIGSSVSVDGACLTVITKTTDSFTAEAIPETLNRTISGQYIQGQKVNLEASLKVGDSLDGHMVSGHIDFKTTLTAIREEGDTKILTLSFPKESAKYFSFKGSVTINGVSLTISKLDTASFEVNIIPHTQKVTNLGTLTTGDEVNIEIDLISRYLDNLLQNREKEATYEFLQKRGFV